MSKARPYIETWLANATDEQRCRLSEFIAILNETGDSGSVTDVLDSCIDYAGLSYIKQCIEIIEWNGGNPWNRKP